MPGTQGSGSQRQQQPNRSSSSSGLILPGPGERKKMPQLGNTPVNNFRPPSGFMDSPDQAAKHAVAEDPQQLLAKLKTGAGQWHELARALPALQRAGFDWLAIEAETGLERVLQSIWTIAGQVYDSLKQQANFPEEKLKYFNIEDSEYKLYPMRILAVSARGPVAEYIVDHDLNTTVCFQPGVHLSHTITHCTLVMFPTCLGSPCTVLMCLTNCIGTGNAQAQQTLLEQSGPAWMHAQSNV